MPDNNLAPYSRSTATRDLLAGLTLYRLWGFMAYQDIISRYRRSILGPFWVAAMMVTQSAALALVFGSIFEMPIKDFLPYVITGISVMLYLGSAFTEGTETFSIYRPLVQATPLPLSFHVLRMCTKHLVVFAHNAAVFLAIYMYFNGRLDLRVTIVPAIALSFLFIVGVTLFNAVLSLRFRDYKYILPHLWTLIFFLTPVMWKPAQLVDKLRFINTFNPAHYILLVMRNGLDGQATTWHDWIGAGVSAFVALLLGYIAFSCARKYIALWV